jgi:hypothetical protein
VQLGFERFQPFEEGKGHKAHAHGCLLPVRRWNVASLWKGHGIKPVAHNAVSCGLVYVSVPPEGDRVDEKVYQNATRRNGAA